MSLKMWKLQKTVVSWCVEIRCAMPVSALPANITTFLCLCPLPPDWPSLPRFPSASFPDGSLHRCAPPLFFSVLCDWPTSGHRCMSTRLKFLEENNILSFQTKCANCLILLTFKIFFCTKEES